jgi:hypothetical protein
MVVHHVWKPTNFFFNNMFSGDCCSEYLATAAFVDEFDNFSNSFNGGKSGDQEKHRVAHSMIKYEECRLVG